MDIKGAFYRKRAAEMMELAEQARDPNLRHALLQLAASWTRLAEEAVKAARNDYPRPAAVPAQPPHG